MPVHSLHALRERLAGRERRRVRRTPAVTEAAVALVLREREPLELLLIKRVDRPGDPWAGHMAFPGGRRQAEDADLLGTALRETHEEVGLRLDRERQVLGELDEVQPSTQRLPPIIIAPYVARVDADATTRPDPREVELTVWIPLPSLREPGAIGEVLIELESGTRRFPAYHYQEHAIWGLTHRILSQFLELAPDRP